MTVDLNDLIYFENDRITEDGYLPMMDFNKRHKPHTIITSDFHVGIPSGNTETFILFASYAANT